MNGQEAAKMAARGKEKHVQGAFTRWTITALRRQSLVGRQNLMGGQTGAAAKTAASGGEEAAARSSRDKLVLSF